ncbi:MAG: glutamate synthase-related protein [Acidimicrobiales bacterium]
MASRTGSTHSARPRCAAADGAGIVVLDHTGVDAEHAPVPALLGLGAVQQQLVQAGRRADVSLVVVADDARDSHAVAALIGFGADAVCPRLAFETVADLADDDDSSDIAAPEAQERLRSAIEGGVRKILSKLGICTIDGYRDARAFEVLGLGADVVERCLAGAPNVVGGLDLVQVGAMVLTQHAEAWPADGSTPTLASPGWVRVRIGGDPHANDKPVVAALNELTGTTPTARGSEPPSAAARLTAAAHLLQRAIAGDDEELYRRFAQLVDDRPPLALVDQLEALPAEAPVPIDEVESAESIARRFSTGAMSHGALSKEAHETLAAAMNLLGARSNCGEGGEDPQRFRTRGRGRDDRNSSIKQVASGRFGVTPEYLAVADEIQIKMAQGSKPGEGGQLPGHKVTREIAALRHTQPGVGLISPPPHHDIYSIEDLAQLVYDLKQVIAAEVSVKLVAGAGVGTIAAGCVKALADTVHISGANGGTGASPLSSIKHAGMPWELGLADAQQALVAAGLRDRVTLRVDGGFATGRHIVTAALLGADEFSFGTAAMIAEGCIMLRACHRDTCTPGIATQRPHLRANFAGTPEGVAAYLLFVAHDVRRRLAALGARSVQEVIGRVDLLRQRTFGNPAVDSVDLAPLLRAPTPADAPRHFVAHDSIQRPRDRLGDELLAEAFRPIWDGDHPTIRRTVANTDRALGAALSGALALEFGARTPPGTATIELDGVAGQSFGAFAGPGVRFVLRGPANDYVGKGLAGATIAIRPDAATVVAPEPPVLAGNTCLYGATGGRLFVAGAVGERFAVRNSGADAVVEAAGDHCCEYMTVGTVVILGTVGTNLGAGMTGGEVLVWDGDASHLAARINRDLVEPVRPDRDARDRARWLVEEHVAITGSARAAALLHAWDDREDDLWQVLPRDEAERRAASAAVRLGVA